MAKKEKEEKSLSKKILILFISILIIIISIILYAYYIGTTGLFIKEYKISNTSLSNNFYGLKIAHISDIHYGRTVNKKELENIVKKVNRTKPDLIFLTGDLIDKDTILTEEMIVEVSKILSNLNANIGKYAISGNHDTMFENWSKIIENSGMNNINDTYTTIYVGIDDYILLSGLSSVTNKKKSLEEKFSNTNAFLSSLKDQKEPSLSILLIHEGDIVDEFDTSNFDLILGGHSHYGQVRLPVIGPILLPNYGKKYYKEHYNLNNGKTDFYISSGIGTSNLNLRLNNRPSFNLYRISNK